MANYGLPYMGSKSKIVKRIVSLFPSADTFVDLFAGGGAVTHYAMTTNRYKHFIYNDLNPLMPKAFKMALNGEFEKEKRWISREDFFRLRDTDPYAAICFSFGNNLSSYMYSKEIELIKEAYHHALFFGDYSLAMERMGIDFTPLGKCHTIKDKCAMLKNIVKNTPPHTHNQWKQGCSQWKDKGGFGEFGTPPKVLWQFESAERMWRCEKISAVISGHNANGSRKLPLSDVIEFYSTDYQAVPIPDNSIIYCDIPYKGTCTYQKHKKTEFDYERFYDWAYIQTQPTFISEYWMPEDRFKCIAEMTHTCTMCSTNNSLKTLEKVFVPKKQRKIINQVKQLRLFD